MTIEPADKLLVDELRQRVKDVLTEFYDNDFNLFRWLTGYDRDLDKAETALRKCLEIRKLLNLDAPLDQLYCHPVIKNYFPSFILQSSPNNGDSCMYMVNLDGAVDIGGLCSCCSVTDFILSKISETEANYRAILEREKKSGNPFKVNILMDLKGLTYDRWLWYTVKGSYSTLFRLMSQCFAECLDNMVIIRSGLEIRAVYKLIQPVLPVNTKSKVIILGSDWKDKLPKHIPPECLLEYYGGSLRHPALEACLKQDKMIIPESLFYDYEANAPDEAKVKELSIGRGCHHIFSFHVQHSGMKLCWWLKTDSNYKMAVLRSDSELTQDQKLKRFKPFSTNSANAEFVYPELLLCSEYVPDENSVNCDQLGWYHVQFVNENWVMSQFMKYVIELKNV